MKGPRRNTAGAQRALDPIRARRATQQESGGIVAGRGLTVDSTGRYEMKLPDGFYWDETGTAQMRLGDGVALLAGSPKRFAVDPTEKIARKLLVAAAPTPDDVKDSSGDTVTVLLQRLRDALDSRLDALESVVHPQIEIGMVQLTGTTPVDVASLIVTTDTAKCSIQLTRRSTSSSAGSEYVDNSSIRAGESFQIVSDDGSDDALVQYQVTVIA